MPNNPAVVSAVVVICISAAAAAIAVYESPQARQFAEDVRRRIAIALHSLGDEINPSPQQPRFNRPEDAEGFMQSSAEPGIEADEDSKRRQREELMYWNAVRMEKIERDRKLAEDRQSDKNRGSSFDDFLQEDTTAEKGTYVYNTGAELSRLAEEGLRNRGVRGLNRGSIYANPFADENNIDQDEQRAIDASLMSPEASEKFEVMSDLYSANEDPEPSREPIAIIAEQLVDTSEPSYSQYLPATSEHAAFPDPPISYPTMEEQHADTNFVNMDGRDNSAYASIHAWADNTNHSFYSPLPVTPRAATPQQEPQYTAFPNSPLFSDPPESVPGDITPTDSVSLVGSGEEVWQPRSGATSDADVMSIDGEGISTPGSWTEVGSVVSENDVGSNIHH